MGFSRQEYWSGLLYPPLGDLPDPGIEPTSPALHGESLPSEPPIWRAERAPIPLADYEAQIKPAAQSKKSPDIHRWVTGKQLQMTCREEKMLLLSQNWRSAV